MRTQRSVIATVALTIILSVAMVGVAWSGAVMRRGGSEGNGSRAPRETQSRPQESRENRDSRERKATPRSESGERARPERTVRDRGAPNAAPGNRDQRPGAPNIAPNNRDQRPGSPNAAPNNRGQRPGSPNVAPNNRDQRPGAPNVAPNNRVQRPGAPNVAPNNRDQRPVAPNTSLSNRNQGSGVARPVTRTPNVGSSYIVRPNDTSKYDRQNERAIRDLLERNRSVNQGKPYFYSGRPYINNRPCYYTYWAISPILNYTVRSSYFYYDFFPYVPYSRVTVYPRIPVAYIEVPIVTRNVYSASSYYLDRPAPDSVERALSDVRLAWVSRDADLLLDHVKSGLEIDVLLDGDYVYTVTSQDYRDMTRDAIQNTITIEFKFDSVRSRGSNRFVAYGTHEFYSASGSKKIVYVSYQFERIEGRWAISEVGSSPKKIVQ